MTPFDIAMSMGGSESFYIVMDTQRQVRQHHVTLESRFGLGNKQCSNFGRCNKGCCKIICCEGKERSGNSFIASQVLSRLHGEKGRYNFL